MNNRKGKAISGYPAAGVLLGVTGILAAVLLTFLFGVAGGAAALILGLAAVLLGVGAVKGRRGGIGAVVCGVLAILLAAALSLASVGFVNGMKQAAREHADRAPLLAPNLEKANPCLGIMSFVGSVIHEPAAQEEFNILAEYLKGGRSAAPAPAKAD